MTRSELMWSLECMLISESDQELASKMGEALEVLRVVHSDPEARKHQRERCLYLMQEIMAAARSEGVAR